MQQQQIWFITGCSTGFGRALTEAVLERGETVVATARKPQQLDDLAQQYGNSILVLPLDVTQSTEVQTAVNQAVANFGRIDVLVNNAGYGVFGAVEEVSDADVRRQFETNVYGAVGFPGAGIYCASKFALEGWSEALAQEVAPLGIHVTIVEPGAFRTAFNGTFVAPNYPIDDYTTTSGQMLLWLRQMDGQQPGDPKKAAVALLQVVKHPHPPLRLVLGSDALVAIDAKLEAVAADLAAWKEVAIATAFEGATVSAIGG